MRVDVNPRLLRWARERAGLSVQDLERRFPHLPAWEERQSSPTFKQLEKYAHTTHAPFGYFFLDEPPIERVPIPDFRTVANRRAEKASPDLLDTIYSCQERQAWYRDYAMSHGETRPTFVSSATLSSNIAEIAAAMRRTLGFSIDERRACPTWSDALRRFVTQLDDVGVLVAINGVVANNTHRKLDPSEFRGFALCDDYAPLIFVNGADTKAAQMFTLAHEFAHLWLGQSALSEPDRATHPLHAVELWCNRVAAEMLVPLDVFIEVYQRDRDLPDELNRLARYFKVSTLVALRRIHDSGALTEREFWNEYDSEVQRLKSIAGGSGGNFYLTEGVRVGRRFGTALVTSTLEGGTLYRDAMHLLGISKVSTFMEFAHRLGLE